MKLIKVLVILTVVAAVVGIGGAFSCDLDKFQLENTKSVENENEKKEKSIENKEISKESVEKNSKNATSTVEKQSTTSVENDSTKKTDKVSQSQPKDSEKTPKTENTPKIENKQEEKKSVNKQVQQETPKPTTPNPTNQPKENTQWEKLGITEYEYYNSPMLKWQKVTHSTFEECQAEGERIISDTTSGYTDYWCYQVNSYSGKMLGVMLKLS